MGLLGWDPSEDGWAAATQLYIHLILPSFKEAEPVHERLFLFYLKKARKGDYLNLKVVRLLWFSFWFQT